MRVVSVHGPGVSVFRVRNLGRLVSLGWIDLGFRYHDFYKSKSLKPLDNALARVYNRGTKSKGAGYNEA